MQTVQFQGKSYHISFAEMSTSLKEKLSEAELKRYVELLEAAQVRPRAVYKEVIAFASKHEDVGEVINLLTFAHIQNHRIVEAETLIKETFEKHPEYLFARINYADQCIRKQQLEKVLEIFPTFDLAELCPEKEVFHTSEFRGFLIMMAYYFLALKEREQALPYVAKAKEIDPEHPSVRYLERKVNKRSLLARLLRQKQ
jgi:tetratricopeptide (TPR) repeat protein